MHIDENRVPATFDEALHMLLVAVEPDDRAYFLGRGSEDTHFGLGTWLRNNWSLWEPEAPLHRWFNKELGLGHADDMSSILIESLVRSVRGVPVNLAEQGEYYRGFWREQGIDPLTQCSLEGPVVRPVVRPVRKWWQFWRK